MRGAGAAARYSAGAVEPCCFGRGATMAQGGRRRARHPTRWRWSCPTGTTTLYPPPRPRAPVCLPLLLRDGDLRCETVRRDWVAQWPFGDLRYAFERNIWVRAIDAGFERWTIIYNRMDMGGMYRSARDYGRDEGDAELAAQCIEGNLQSLEPPSDSPTRCPHTLTMASASQDGLDRGSHNQPST